MPLKASIGLSKKVGLPDYGSIGAHCQLEVELDSTLIEDAGSFHEKIRRLYTLCHQSIVDQLAQHTQQANGNGTPGNNGHGNGANGARSNGSNGHQDPASNQAPTSTPANRNGDQNGDDTPASNKQIKFLLDLARQNHAMNMTQTGQYCQQLVGLSDVYRLTKSQASLVIENLGGKSNNGNGRTRTSGRR